MSNAKGTSATKMQKQLVDKQKKKANKSRVGQSVISKSARAAVPGGAVKPDVLKMLTSELVNGNAAQYRYLASLAEPGMPGRPPLDLGEWILDTGMYEFPLEFTVTAGAAGVVYVALVADGWSGASDRQFAVTPGATCWYSGTNATGTPAYGAAAGANDIRQTISAPSDLTLTAGMQWRMVANIVEVWPESVLTNTSGSIMLASMASPSGYDGNSLNNITYATIGQYSQQYVNHTAFPVGGWESGHTARVHLCPSAQTHLAFYDLAATAAVSTAPTFGAVVIGSGFQSGETLRVRVWTKFEISKLSGRCIDPVMQVPDRPIATSTVAPMLALANIPHTKGVPAKHAARPIMAMEAVTPGSATSLLGQVKDGFAGLLGTGLKAASSFLPGIVGKGISALSKLIF